MDAIRVGLVGPGAIGAVHRDAIAAAGGAVLAGFAGGSADSRARFAATTGAGAYETAEAMIAAGGLDAVVIATPGGLHDAPARAALAAGLHVLVEKPLATDLDAAADLARRARASGLVCATVSQRRFEPAHRHLHAGLRSGALGRPLLIEAQVHWHRDAAYYAEKPWRRMERHGGGSLFNQGIHSLDLMLWLGGPVHSVIAQAANLDGAEAAETLCQALLVFDSGARGALTTTTATPPGRPAMLSLFTDRGHAHLRQSEVAEWTLPGPPPPADGAGPASGAARPLDIGLAGHVAQWRDFCAAIRGHRPPAITFEDGLAAVRAVAAIYRAAETGRRVFLSEMGDD